MDGWIGRPGKRGRLGGPVAEGTKGSGANLRPKVNSDSDTGLTYDDRKSKGVWHGVC